MQHCEFTNVPAKRPNRYRCLLQATFSQVGKPTITCAGFFNSMEYNMVPLSSEVSDIITAVLDGTDCVYLDVTERSAHKVHCVHFASSICRQAELALNDKKSFSELTNKVGLIQKKKKLTSQGVILAEFFFWICIITQ